MEGLQEDNLASQVKEEAEKLKLFYKNCSKELENWPEADRLVCCSDEQFDGLLESLSPKDLQASVLILQRQIDIEQQQTACLEILEDTSHGEGDGTLARIVDSQSRLARLRSRMLRCLTKQLKDHGNQTCELPRWTGPVTAAESTSALQTDQVMEEDSSNVINQVNQLKGDMEENREQPSCTVDSTDDSDEEKTNEENANKRESSTDSGEEKNIDSGVTKNCGESTSGDEKETAKEECVEEAKETEEASVKGCSTSNKEEMVVPKEGNLKSESQGVLCSRETHQLAKGEPLESDDTDTKLEETSAAPQTQLHYDPSRQATVNLDEIGNVIEKARGSSEKPNATEESASTAECDDSNIKETVDLNEMAVVLKKAAAENRRSYQEWKLKRTQSEEKSCEEDSSSPHSSPPSSPPHRPPPYKGDSIKRIPEEKKMDMTYTDVPDAVVITEKVNVQNWDPTPLLRDMFGELKPISDIKSDTSGAPVGNVRMAGYMDKLPSSYKQKKSSIFKGWKRRHFKAAAGKLFYYEDHRCSDPLGVMDLKDCTVSISGKMLEILEKDSDGALKVRCSSGAEAEDWKEAIDAEVANWNADCEGSSLADSVIIIDLGSSSVKAGFAHEEAWPQVIFPCVCAVLKEDDSNRVYGFQALEPQRRKKSKIVFPLRRSFKIDKLKFSPADLIGVMEHAFLSLKVDPSKHKVIMTIPQNTGLKEKEELVEILLGYFRVEAAYLQEQAILAMYSYSAVSGIVVDVGDHIDVIPVVEGCIIESGASRLPYGGRQVTDTLARQLTEKGHRFFSEVETFITRLIKEQACYVTEDPIDGDTPEVHATDVNLAKYDIPDGTIKVTVDTARYRCTEGLFEPRHWGKDHPGIHELTYKAIQACAMDMRKQMCRNIYLSGGGSMIPGFPERLQSEVSAFLPSSSHAQVHAGTDRHHAAFIGASVVARLPIFDQLCISQEDWDQMGPEALEKWQNL